LVSDSLPVMVVSGANFIHYSGMVLNLSHGIYFWFQPRPTCGFLSLMSRVPKASVMPAGDQSACSIPVCHVISHAALWWSGCGEGTFMWQNFQTMYQWH
jgi:ABC-type uncharacterized transport system permease subunit